MTQCYLERYYHTASEEERSAFRKLLELPDPQLYSALLDEAEGLDPTTRKIAGLIRESCGSQVT